MDVTSFCQLVGCIRRQNNQWIQDAPWGTEVIPDFAMEGIVLIGGALIMGLLAFGALVILSFVDRRRERCSLDRWRKRIHDQR